MHALFDMLKAKLCGRSGQAGESITEVLVAMTIAGLALIMLCMAISSAFSIVNGSGAVSEKYYKGDNALADLSGGADNSIEVSGGPVSGDTASAIIRVRCADASASTPGSATVVAYKATELKGRGDGGA